MLWEKARTLKLSKESFGRFIEKEFRDHCMKYMTNSHSTAHPGVNQNMREINAHKKIQQAKSKETIKSVLSKGIDPINE